MRPIHLEAATRIKSQSAADDVASVRQNERYKA